MPTSISLALASEEMAANFTHSKLALWTTAFAVESVAIIVGNAVTIAIFWEKRSTLNRTRFFLINLSVADLFIGVGVMEDIVCFTLRYKNDACKVTQKTNVADAIFGMASLSFLVVIALERLHAVTFPLRHRTIATKTYFFVIGTTWTVSAMLIIITYPIFSYFALYILLQPIVISTYTATCLIIITAAYLTIFIYSRKRVPRVELNREQNHNKLTKTLFIVTLLSLITWTPHGIANVLRFTTHDVEGEVYLAGQFCRLANSYVNPIVYCLQMPEFRERLINLFAFKRRNKDASGPQNQLAIAESMDPDFPVLLSFTRLDATQEFKTTMILVSKM